jgi:hypothetical protein
VSPRRRLPVTDAERLGVLIRRRCGKCILWLLGLLALGAFGNQVLVQLTAVQKVLDDRNREILGP